MFPLYITDYSLKYCWWSFQFKWEASSLVMILLCHNRCCRLDYWIYIQLWEKFAAYMCPYCMSSCFCCVFVYSMCFSVAECFFYSEGRLKYSKDALNLVFHSVWDFHLPKLPSVMSRHKAEPPLGVSAQVPDWLLGTRQVLAIGWPIPYHMGCMVD